MEYRFKTLNENDRIFVLIIKDQITIAKIETTNPLATMQQLIARIQNDPHMIFSIEIIIIGTDITLSKN